MAFKNGIIENLEEWKLGIANGDFDAQDAVTNLLDPLNPDGVWGDMLVKLEKEIFGSESLLYQLDEDRQAEFHQIFDAIKGFSAGRAEIGKEDLTESYVNIIYREAGLDINNISSLRDKLATGKYKAVLDFSQSEFGEDYSLIAVPNTRFTPENIAESEFDLFPMTGFESGIVTQLYVKMKKLTKDKDDGRFVFNLPGVGEIEIDKSGYGVDDGPFGKAVGIEESSIKVNGQAFTDKVFISNPDSRTEAIELTNQFASFYQQAFRKPELSPAEDDWIKQQVKNRVGFNKFKSDVINSPEFFVFTNQIRQTPLIEENRQSVLPQEFSGDPFAPGPQTPKPPISAPIQSGKGITGGEPIERAQAEIGQTNSRLRGFQEIATQGFSKFRQAFKSTNV